LHFTVVIQFPSPLDPSPRAYGCVPAVPTPYTQRHAARLTLVQRKEEARVAAERKKLAWQRDHAYDDIMTEDNLAESSNQDRDEDFLDDFM
jgi:hypothetical protein